MGEVFVSLCNTSLQSNVFTSDHHHGDCLCRLDTQSREQMPGSCPPTLSLLSWLTPHPLPERFSDFHQGYIRSTEVSDIIIYELRKDVFRNQEKGCRGVVHPHLVFFPGLHRIPCQSDFPIFIRVTSVRQKFPTSSFTNFARTHSADESFSCETATVRTVAEMEPLSMLAVSLIRREQLR